MGAHCLGRHVRRWWDRSLRTPTMHLLHRRSSRPGCRPCRKVSITLRKSSSLIRRCESHTHIASKVCVVIAAVVNVAVQASNLGEYDSASYVHTRAVPSKANGRSPVSRVVNHGRRRRAQSAIQLRGRKILGEIPNIQWLFGRTDTS